MQPTMSENANTPGKYLDRPSAFPWPPVLWFGAMGLAWLAQTLWPLPWPGMDDLAARLVGWGLGLGGVALTIWALLALRAAGTTVLPDKGSDALVTTGPFQRFRNPIYLAHVMILLWLAEYSKNPWFILAAFVHVILVTALAIIPEERHLEARFGEAYTEYKARSRRWI
jgi:protein-S-isoprenylcysteine O-methyltransferase Ste14